MHICTRASHVCLIFVPLTIKIIVYYSVVIKLDLHSIYFLKKACLCVHTLHTHTYTYTNLYTHFCVYIQAYIYIHRSIYIHAYIQCYVLECNRKKRNLLNACNEIDTSIFASCKTSGTCENWNINLHFIQVLQFTWVSRIEPGNKVSGKKKASLLIFFTVDNQNREINSTYYNSSWNKYGIYL